MRAELILTGSELLLGHVENMHASYLGRQLAGLGIEVILTTTVGDDPVLMEHVLRVALERADLVITTGGLGPTTDDITREVVAAVLGVPLVTDAEALARIQDFFARRGTVMTRGFDRQACFPEGATVLPNPVGRAAGALVERAGKVIIMLPGPPRELHAMFAAGVLPYLRRSAVRSAVLRTRVLKLTGLPEYVVQEKLRVLDNRGNPALAYLAKPGEVQVRVSARALDAGEAERMVGELADKVTTLLGEYVFAVDDELPEQTVGDLFLQNGLTMAVAESCTAGMLAARLTNVSGSSRYFLGGVVAYSNELKRALVGVPAAILERYGAVSEETAVAMARGIRRVTGADLGLSVTGIAGPEGGTTVKPVGLVYVALADGRKTECYRLLLSGEREAVRRGTLNSGFRILKVFLKAPGV